MATAGFHREVEKRMRDHDVRYTRGRRGVVEALSSADGPRSASELHGELGGRIPLSSVYRSLAVLEEVGVLVPHLGTRGLTRYEPAEWLQGHHHHLICIDCGAVEDVAVPLSFESEVQLLVDRVSAMASFDPVGHALEIEGRCTRCA